MGLQPHRHVTFESLKPEHGALSLESVCRYRGPHLSSLPGKQGDVVVSPEDRCGQLTRIGSNHRQLDEERDFFGGVLQGDVDGLPIRLNLEAVLHEQFDFG